MKLKYWKRYNKREKYHEIFVWVKDREKTVGYGGITHWDNQAEFHDFIISSKYRRRGIASKIVDILLASTPHKKKIEFEVVISDSMNFWFSQIPKLLSHFHMVNYNLTAEEKAVQDRLIPALAHYKKTVYKTWREVA
jgi:hypothetical protein